MAGGRGWMIYAVEIIRPSLYISFVLLVCIYIIKHRSRGVPEPSLQGTTQTHQSYSCTEGWLFCLNTICLILGYRSGLSFKLLSFQGDNCT